MDGCAILIARVATRADFQGVLIMAKALAAVGAMIALSACSTQLKWHAEQQVDPFTNARTCMVTTWYEDNGPLQTVTYRPSQQLYPVAQRQEDKVFVGFMTAPMRVGKTKFAGPAGDVQLKIDGNSPITIAAVETPAAPQQGTSLDVLKQRTGDQMDAMLKNNPYADPAAIKSARWQP
jgi:hypothetical protein